VGRCREGRRRTIGEVQLVKRGIIKSRSQGPRSTAVWGGRVGGPKSRERKERKKK